jgi:peptide/nickel transport system substrate-binding protein/oligopeptide transport system substrate-binding protein
MLIVGLMAFGADLFLTREARTSTSDQSGTFFGYLSSEPSNLDPARGVDVNEANVQAKIFDGLVRYDENMKLIGGLAESWTVSSEGKEYIFELRKNVFFHNGQRFTADDVVFSLDRLLAPKVASPRTWVLEKVEGANERMKGLTNQVKGITKIDDHRISIKLASPFAPFMSLLTMPACYILPHSSAREIENKKFFEMPAGTGPFKVVKRVRDSYLKLKANNSYFGNKPEVAQIELRIIPENMKAEMEFESGNLDLLQLYPSNYQRFNANPKHSKRIHNVPAMNVFYVGFNNQKAPFNNVKVRKALNMLIDRDKIISAIFQGRAVPAKGSIPPGISGYDKDAKGYGYNPKKGLRLLKEAGFDKENPLSFDLYQKSAQAAYEITRLLQGELKKHGVIVNLKPMEWSALKDAISKGEAPSFYLSWFGDYPDGENFLYPLFHSNNWGSGGNRARFSNPEIDKMIEDAVKIQDPDMRSEAYSRINEKIYEQAPWLYLWHSSESYLTSSQVNNIDFSPLFFCDKGLTISVKH